MANHALRLILLVQDKMTTTPKVVPVWEVALYKDRFVVESVTDAPAEYKLPAEVDAVAEYQRLAGVHGRDPETRLLLVEREFGRGDEGIEKLQKAIDKALSGPGKAKADPPFDPDPKADTKSK